MNEPIEDIFGGLPCDIYKAILNQTYDGIYFVNTEREILFWNKGAEIITGFKHDEVINRHCYEDITCYIDNQGNRTCKGNCPLDVLANNTDFSRRRLHLKRKDGKRVPVDVVGTSIRDDQGQVIGAVEIFRDASAFEAVENAAVTIAKLSATDPLTGLLNRRAFEIELEIESNRAQRLKLPLALIFGDIDYFKMVNDTHGHPVGDEVLKGIAKILKSGARDYDRVARYGGEEFIMILPETKAEIAVEIAERLRRAIEIWKLIHQEKLWPIAITMSFGVAELNKEESLESLIDRTDKALYRAKKSGRNAVFLS